jgi:histidyl-tRNA synthetase
LDELDVEDVEHFDTVCELLDRAGVAYDLDSTLVRGLDYYTRTVFEFTSDALGAQSGVGGGGRYDGLVAQLGGPATPGMGWAAGVERILLAGSPPPVGGHAVDLYVAITDFREHGGASGVKASAFEVLSEARLAGLTAQMEMGGRSLKGQLTRADRVGARFVAIVGEGETLLKDMQTGTQEKLDTDKVVHAALRGSHELT